MILYILEQRSAEFRISRVSDPSNILGSKQVVNNQYIFSKSGNVAAYRLITGFNQLLYKNNELISPANTKSRD